MASHRDSALEMQPLDVDEDESRDRHTIRYREARCQPSMFQNSIFRAAAYIGMLIAGWYLLSTSLSIYNKKLVGKNYGIFGKGSFPAPLFMSSLQFLFQNLIAKTVFKLGLMQRTAGGMGTWGWREYCKQIVPNGITTGLDIGFSNMSLVFINLSFYTMCKATSPVFLLLFAFIWGIEKPSMKLAGVVSIIVVGLVLLVAGETDFDALGFILAMTAACLSGLRFTLTQMLLHGSHDKHAHGSPLEVLEVLTPIMAASTMVLSLLFECLWSSLPGSPYFSTIEHTLVTMLIIAAGAVIAFCMVWCEYVLVSETSSLTLMVAGICKEILTVLAAIMVFGERLGAVNGLGLGVTIVGVIMFNIFKYQKVKSGEIATHKGAPKCEKQKLESDESEEPLLAGGSRSGSVAALPLSTGLPSVATKSAGSFEPLSPLASPFIVRR